MTTNASYIYYRHRDFGEDLNYKDIKEILALHNNSLTTATIGGVPYLNYFKVPNAASFSLKTTYPGLIIGTGYNHPSRGNDKDFQNGFYFDHTTGMPVIPGSTVKGIIKAVFPKQGDSKEIIDEKLRYVNGILKNLPNPLLQGEITIKNWEALFEKGNIFYDAYISGVPSNGKIFAEDYITPHKDIFKNPIPLRFLKIAPGVTFTFQFRLVDSCIDSKKLTANDKALLFKKILLDFGIGAKRNVGYGNLVLKTKLNKVV